MVKKNVESFEIVQHHKHSWSYNYIINGRKRDIYGTSLKDLKRQVLNMGLEWDEEKFPEEKIIKSKYDADERVIEVEDDSFEPIEYKRKSFEEEIRFDKSRQLPLWVPSSKKHKNIHDEY